MTEDDELTQFLTQKWVRVMCDVSCEGIWRKDGCPAFLDELSISEALQKQFLA